MFKPPHYRRRAALGTIAAAVSLAFPTLARSTAVPLLGLTLPMEGVQREVALDLLEGYKLAAAASGGSFDLALLDDGSDAARTQANVKDLAGRPNVLALSGIVGTPHAQAALPVAVKAGLPVIGIRSGADELRRGEAGIFHLRSSYSQELTRLASVLKGGNMEQIQVLYSDDSFGKGALASLKTATEASGVSIVRAMPVARNGDNLAEATQQLADNVRSMERFSAVVLLLINKPMIQAAEMLRSKHKIVAPIFAMSFVANRSLATKAMAGLEGLGVTIAFPLPRSNVSTTALAFKAEMAKQGKGELVDSLTAYEGFFYGSVFAAAIQQGRATSRDQITARMQQGLTVGNTRVAFDSRSVGYEFIDIVYKSASAGRFLR